MLTWDWCKMLNTKVPMICKSCVPYPRSFVTLLFKFIWRFLLFFVLLFPKIFKETTVKKIQWKLVQNVWLFLGVSLTKWPFVFLVRETKHGHCYYSRTWMSDCRCFAYISKTVRFNHILTWVKMFSLTRSVVKFWWKSVHPC